MKTENAIGWGRRVGGSCPYLAYEFSRTKAEVEITQPYHRAVRVILLPLSEYRRLKRQAKEAPHEG
jgi:hypothetical protein